MRISFQRATANERNESFLLRVDSLGSPTQCLLFDAGPGVDIDSLLGENDEFLGTCLTHAHSDHYASIKSVQSAASQRKDATATVYTAPGTAAVLGDVLDVAARQAADTAGPADSPGPPDGQGAGDGGALAGAGGGTVEAVDDWTTLSETVAIRPVPAGHAPGAAGFLVRVGDDDDERLCLVTGDWTLRDAGGTPGLPVDALPQVDVLFLTTATATGVEETLTDVVATTLERAGAGSPTLVTANGLAGAHLARLLDTAARGFDVNVPVRVVGHTAKLYDQLYDTGEAGEAGETGDGAGGPEAATDGGSEATAGGAGTRGPTAPDSAVECVPVFDSPGACLDPGVVTVAGPDLPTEQSSGKLFDALSGNPNACVYQVIGSGRSPVREADCTLHDAELANHPPEAALERVVDAVDPRHTVVMHERDASGAYNYLDSMVWAGDSDEIHELYNGHTWQMPPWTHQSFLFTDDDEGYQGTVPDDLPRARGGPVDLAREGVDVDAVSERLHARYEPDRAAGVSAATEADAGETAATEAGETAATEAGETDAETADAGTGATDTATAGRTAETETAAAETAEGGTAGTETTEAETATKETAGTAGTETETTTTETAELAASATTETGQSAASTGADDGVRHVAVSPVAAGLAARVAADGDRSLRAVVDDATATYLRALLAGEADGAPAEAVEIDATVSDGLRRAFAALGDDGDATEAEAGHGAAVDDRLASALGAALAPDGLPETLPLPTAGFAAGGIDAVADNPDYALDSPSAVVEAAVCRAVADER